MLVRKYIPMLSTLMGVALLLTANSAMAEYGLNITRGVTDISREVYSLHMMIFWICVVIGVVVFSAMFYSIISHRKSKGAVAAHFHESTAIEILWTLIPTLILISIAIPATKTLIAMDDSSNADITVNITGFQWKWKYEYMGEGVSFFSSLATSQDEIHNTAAKGEHYLLEVDNRLVLPVGKKVRFVITANDVIHSWSVPAFAIKKDAIPGFVNEVWTIIDEPGIYRGQCSELCGKDHGFMPVVVEAKSEADYAIWLNEQKALAAAASEDPNKVWTHDELMAKGEAVYAANCVACHQAGGEGVPGVFPALKGSKIATGPVADHLDRVINGKTGTAMAAFGVQMNDTDLAAVITYERNAWGNNTGETVQPSQVKAAR